LDQHLQVFLGVMSLKMQQDSLIGAAMCKISQLTEHERILCAALMEKIYGIIMRYGYTVCGKCY
jgi:hypothetical protein